MKIDIPKDQHCQRGGKVKESVDYCIVQGYKFLCDECLDEVLDDED